MAIASVTSTQIASVSGASVTTASVDTTGANLIVLGLSAYANADMTISDSKGNTWTALTRYEGSYLGSFFSRLYYCLSPTVGSGHTFSAANNGTLQYAVLSVQAFSGVDVYDSAENGATDSAGSATALSTGSVTPSANGALVFANVCLRGVTTGQTFSVTASLTIAHQTSASSGNCVSGAIAYLIQGSAAAINPQWSWTNGDGAAVSVAVFKPTAGGGGGNPWHYYAQLRERVKPSRWRRNGLIWTPSYAFGKVA